MDLNELIKQTRGRRSLLQAMGESDAHFGSGDAAHEGPLPDLTA